MYIIIIQMSKSQIQVFRPNMYCSCTVFCLCIAMQNFVCVCNSYRTFLMSSSVWISGESPPCTHRNCWFISAARGRQSNASMQESYTCSEYLILPGGVWRNGEIFQDLGQRSAWVCFDMLWTATVPANVHSVPVTWSVTSNAENKHCAFTRTDKELSHLEASNRLARFL